MMNRKEVVVAYPPIHSKTSKDNDICCLQPVHQQLGQAITARSFICGTVAAAEPALEITALVLVLNESLWITPKETCCCLMVSSVYCAWDTMRRQSLS